MGARGKPNVSQREQAGVSMVRADEMEAWAREQSGGSLDKKMGDRAVAIIFLEKNHSYY